MLTRTNRPAPEFALTDTAGAIVRLSSFRDRQRVVLVFTRGLF